MIPKHKCRDFEKRRIVRAIGGAVACAVVGVPFPARSASRDVAVAMLLPLRGAQAKQAELVRQGVDSAIEQANRAGGIKGLPVRLVVVDNDYDPNKTIAGIASLARNDSVVAVSSLLGGPNIGAAIPAATQAGLPIVGVLHGNDAFRVPGTEIVTHVRATFDAEFRAIASVFSEIGRRRFAALHAPDKSGLAFLAQLESALKSQGLPLVAAVPYDREAVDYSAQARAVERAGADLLVVGGVTAPGIAAIRAKKTTGLKAQVVCLSTADERSVWEQLGADAIGTAFSCVVPNPYTTLLPIAREYQAAASARRYQEISLSSFEGFINAQVLLEALRRTPAMERTALQATLRSMRSVSLGGVTFTAVADGKLGAGINVADIQMMTNRGRMLR